MTKEDILGDADFMGVQIGPKKLVKLLAYFVLITISTSLSKLGLCHNVSSVTSHTEHFVARMTPLEFYLFVDITFLSFKL